MIKKNFRGQLKTTKTTTTTVVIIRTIVIVQFVMFIISTLTIWVAVTKMMKKNTK